MNPIKSNSDLRAKLKLNWIKWKLPSNRNRTQEKPDIGPSGRRDKTQPLSWTCLLEVVCLVSDRRERWGIDWQPNWGATWGDYDFCRKVDMFSGEIVQIFKLSLNFFLAARGKIFFCCWRRAWGDICQGSASISISRCFWKCVELVMRYLWIFKLVIYVDIVRCLLFIFSWV
jgi:hypothetical protein